MSHPKKKKGIMSGMPCRSAPAEQTGAGQKRMSGLSGGGAPDDELVALAQQRLQHGDLGGHLAAAHDGHKGADRRGHGGAQKAQLLAA